MSGKRTHRFHRIVLILLALVFAVATVPLASQSPSTPAASDRRESAGLEAALARGWSALAEGDLDSALAEARKALARFPRSAAALALSLEVDLARGGAVAGLDTYEQWLGAKRVDAAHLLRRVATAYLREAARRRDGGLSRVEALNALVADGDESAREVLSSAGPTDALQTPAPAAPANEDAVRTLIAQLKSLPNKRATIDALVKSRSPLAVAPLVDMLADPRDENRAAAADGLGRLGARDAAKRLRPLLEDGSFPVRFSAAKALYRLGDDSAAPLLEELLTSEHSAVRIGAAEALSVRPEGAWQSVARALVHDPDQTVQLQAARLIAPYDRELAEQVLKQLRQSDNPAVREEAGRVLIERVANDFATLRKLLRDGDGLTAVRAAGRILELTR